MGLSAKKVNPGQSVCFRSVSLTFSQARIHKESQTTLVKTRAVRLYGEDKL